MLLAQCSYERVVGAAMGLPRLAVPGRWRFRMSDVGDLDAAGLTPDQMRRASPLVITVWPGVAA
jgi:hypothetical protein